jgi:hypothetical protein
MGTRIARNHEGQWAGISQRDDHLTGEQLASSRRITEAEHRRVVLLERFARPRRRKTQKSRRQNANNEAPQQVIAGACPQRAATHVRRNAQPKLTSGTVGRVEGQPVDAQQIVAAYDATAAAGLARARFEVDTGWSAAEWGKLGGALPGWIRALGRPLVWFARWRAREADFDPSRHVEEGVVDLAGRRSAMRVPQGWIEVTAGGQSWTGEPGERLEDPVPADTTCQPLWLLGLLKGTVSAALRDRVEVRGASCSAYEVAADLGRASAATPGGLAPCQARRFEDLLCLPLTVCVDDEGRIRRVAGSDKFGETGNTGYVVELYGFGSVPQIDWTRVPRLDEGTG